MWRWSLITCMLSKYWKGVFNQLDSHYVALITLATFLLSTGGNICPNVLVNYSVLCLLVFMCMTERAETTPIFPLGPGMPSYRVVFYDWQSVLLFWISSSLSCSVCVQLSQFSRASHSCCAILHIHSHITLQIAPYSSCAGVWVPLPLHVCVHIIYVTVSICECMCMRVCTCICVWLVYICITLCGTVHDCNITWWNISKWVPFK